MQIWGLVEIPILRFFKKKLMWHFFVMEYLSKFIMKKVVDFNVMSYIIYLFIFSPNFWQIG
jgi:hypothetical protein